MGMTNRRRQRLRDFEKCDNIEVIECDCGAVNLLAWEREPGFSDYSDLSCNACGNFITEKRTDNLVEWELLDEAAREFFGISLTPSPKSTKF